MCVCVCVKIVVLETFYFCLLFLLFLLNSVCECVCVCVQVSVVCMGVDSPPIGPKQQHICSLAEWLDREIQQRSNIGPPHQFSITIDLFTRVFSKVRRHDRYASLKCTHEYKTKL